MTGFCVLYKDSMPGFNGFYVRVLCLLCQGSMGSV